MAVEEITLNNGSVLTPGSTVFYNGGYDTGVYDENNGCFPFTPLAPTFLPYSSFVDQIPVAPSVLRDFGPFYYLKFDDQNRWESMDDVVQSIEDNVHDFQELVTNLFWIVGSVDAGGIAFGRTSENGDLYCVYVDGYYSDGQYVHVGNGTNSISYIPLTYTIDNTDYSQENLPIAPKDGEYPNGIVFYNCYDWDDTRDAAVYQGYGFNVNAGAINARAGWTEDPGGLQPSYEVYTTFTTTGEYLGQCWSWHYNDDLPSAAGAIEFNKEKRLQFMLPNISQPCGWIFGDTEYIEGTSLFGGKSTEFQFDNPYKNPGSGPGGGFGDQNRYSEDTLPEGIPGIDLLNSGFIKLYNPSKAQLSEFARFLFSDITESMADVFKRMITNPLEYIISVHMIHIPLSHDQVSEIGFCGISSQVTANEVDKQYYEIEYELQINEFWRSALDYTNYTKAKIHIPYCGIYDISIDEFQNGTMFLHYVVDCVSGACIAQLGTKRLQKDNQTWLRAVLYQFNGNCILSMPISSTNWQGVFNSIMSIATTAIAPGTSALSGMANDILGQKISVQKSGSLAANYGYLGKQTPYVIFERPELSMPADYGKHFGFPSNMRVYLGGCHGFTVIEQDGIITNDIDGITPEEADELKQLLTSGVYFD